MESLRQVEEDLRAFMGEVDRRYPEVCEACARALQTLKAIREEYIASLRNKDSSLRTPTLPQSSDLVAPFVLLCNYADAPGRLVASALHCVSLQIQFDVVPHAEIKNIVRVLHIQAHSARLEAHLKLLQIAVLLATSAIKSRNVDGSLSEHSTVQLLSLPLLLADPRHPTSIQTAAVSTAKQMLSQFLQEMLRCERRSPWLVNSSLAFFDDLVRIATGKASASKAPAASRINNVSISFALDAVFEIADSFDKLRFDAQEERSHISQRLLPLVQAQLRDLRKQFDAEFESHGVASSASLSFRVFRLVRLAVLDNLHDQAAVTHVFTLLFHCFQPPAPEHDMRAERSSDNGLFSKLSQNLSQLNALARSQFGNQHETGTPSSSSKTNFYEVYMEFQQRMFAPPSSSAALSSDRCVAMHPATCALEICVATLLRVSSSPPSTHHCKLVKEILTHASDLLNALLGSWLANSSRQNVDSCIESGIVNALRKFVDSELKDTFSSREESLIPLVSLIEALSATAAVRSFELLSMASIVIILSTRYLFHLVFQKIASAEFVDEKKHHINLPQVVKDTLSAHTSADNPLDWLDSLKSTNEGVIESLVDCSTSLLRNNVPSLLQSSAVIMLNELSLLLGVLGMSKQHEIVLSALCKQSLPLWHEKDLLLPDALPQGRNNRDNAVAAPPPPPPPPPAPLRFENRHAMLFVCLLRHVHILGNAISDWDSVVDAWDQLFLRTKTVESNGGGAHKDLSFLCALVERFPSFTLSLEEESLVRLMTSLVALSTNSLVTEQRQPAIFSNNDSFNADLANVIQSASSGSSPVYLLRGLQEKSLPFAFKFAVDIAKANSSRVSSIWQMVMSHIRVMAAVKNPSTRSIALVSLFDVMLSTANLICKKQQQSLPQSAGIESLCNENPCLESCFLPAQDIFILQEKDNAPAMAGQLKLNDVFGCMKSVAAVNFTDVRLNLLKGLHLLVEENAELLRCADCSGWRVAIEILSSIPLSFFSDSEQESWLHSRLSHSKSQEDESLHSFQIERQWPTAALSEGFQCLQMMVEDFLADFLADLSLVANLFECLALYAAQSVDLNMALTALELLWKVSDASVTTAKSVQKNDVMLILFMMLEKIFRLALDNRSEVRNGAVNTFFSTTTAYSFVLDAESYKSLFEDLVFRWFESSASRIAEIGSDSKSSGNSSGKLSLHHSRNSPLKQWSETRVLAMRGLLRLVRSSVRTLLMEAWFGDVWMRLLRLCMNAVLNAGTFEQASGGVELFFGLLLLSSDNIADVAASIEDVEKQKLALWTRCLRSLPTIALCSTRYADLTVLVSQKLLRLFRDRREAEFRYSENVQLLVWSVVALVRPLNTCENSLFSSQAQVDRSLVELVNALASDLGSQDVLVGALVEVSLSVLPMTVHSALLDNPQRTGSSSGVVCAESQKLISQLLHQRDNVEQRERILNIFCNNFLKTVCRNRVAFMDASVVNVMQEKKILPADRTLDDKISVTFERNEKNPTQWIFLFAHYHSILSMLMDFLQLPGRSDRSSPDLESKIFLTIAFLFSPWPTTEDNAVAQIESTKVEQFSSLFSSLLSLITAPNQFSLTFQCSVIELLTNCLIQGLILEECSSMLECDVQVLHSLIHNFHKFVVDFLADHSDPRILPIKQRLHAGIVFLVRQLSNNSLFEKGSCLSFESLEMCASSLNSLDSLVSPMLLPHRTQPFLWQCSTVSSKRTPETISECWLKVLEKPFTELISVDQYCSDEIAHSSLFLHGHFVELMTRDYLPNSLRDKIMELLRSVDLIQLVETMSRLSSSNNQLQQRCADLLQEVKQVRSAAAFPF